MFTPFLLYCLLYHKSEGFVVLRFCYVIFYYFIFIIGAFPYVLYFCFFINILSFHFSNSTTTIGIKAKSATIPHSTIFKHCTLNIVDNTGIIITPACNSTPIKNAPTKYRLLKSDIENIECSVLILKACTN